MKKKCFVLFGSMRTGSNVLNQNLNQFNNVCCHGEVFNPTLKGLTEVYLNKFGGLDSAQKERDRDPVEFMEILIEATDAQFVGFHLFPGHSSEVVSKVLADTEIKKICLRRSLFQSYVSLCIAHETNVWLVRHEQQKKRIPSPQVQIEFRANNFERYAKELNRFWQHIFSELEKTNQECFPIWYNQVNDLDTLNQCAEFLGFSERLTKIKKTLIKQNPSSLEHAVLNYKELQEYAHSQGLDKHLY